MLFLRLLLAFALTIAIPLQGHAAPSCICTLRQAQNSAAPHADPSQAAVALAHGSTAPHTKCGAMSDFASAPSHAAPHALCMEGPAYPAKHAGISPTCTLSCCQAALSPPRAPAIEFANVHALALDFLPAAFASWAEPVPRKPPRC